MRDIYREEATEMWQRMEPQIRKLAMRVSQFTNGDIREYLFGLSWEGCYRGVLNYRRFKRGLPYIKPNGDIDLARDMGILKSLSESMRRTTFMYWYLQKIFYKQVDKEIRYIVISPDGEIEIYLNREFRKKYNKKRIMELENKGYRIMSDRIFQPFGDITERDDTYDIPDSNGDFDTWQIKKQNGRSVW